MATRRNWPCRVARGAKLSEREQPMAKLGVQGPVAFTNSGSQPMRKIIVLTVATVAMAVSGCNTISGLGRDVAAAGSAVTSSAETARN